MFTEYEENLITEVQTLEKNYERAKELLKQLIRAETFGTINGPATRAAFDFLTQVSVRDESVIKAAENLNEKPLPPDKQGTV